METREILTRFKNGELSMEEAEHYFRKEPFEEMDDYAKLDSHREIRSGFPEVIFCSGKADQHFVHIFKKLYEDNGEVFGTRASRHQYELVKDLLPGVEYDELFRCIKRYKNPFFQFIWYSWARIFKYNLILFAKIYSRYFYNSFSAGTF